jgi:uncharacterized oligopeptide transporter (OPT) family protein
MFDLAEYAIRYAIAVVAFLGVIALTICAVWAVAAVLYLTGSTIKDSVRGMRKRRERRKLRKKLGR